MTILRRGAANVSGNAQEGQADMAAPEHEDRLTGRVSAALRQALAAPLAPGLYLVATPIGNLADMSLRGLAALARAEHVCCEDTRHTRKLLSHYGLSPALSAYHEHNAAKVRPRILERLERGERVALVSDAGTPLVSDPGYKLAREALDAGHRVFSVPGASAALAALTSSGLSADRFLFEGFLPPKREARRKRLAELADARATLIFYEAPSRLEAMLEDAAEVLGAREAAVAKELTKLHEGILRGSVGDIVESMGKEFAAKGEFVVLLGPPGRSETGDAAIEAALRDALVDMSARDAAREVAERLGVSRSRVYRLGLAIKEGEG